MKCCDFNYVINNALEIDGKIDVKLTFLIISSSEVQFECVVHMEGQAKHGLWGSNMKTGKYLPGAARLKFLYVFVPES